MRTFSGHPYDLIISALSKLIRRQKVPEALWCAEELVLSLCTPPNGGQEVKEYIIRRSNVMNRLMVAALEDNCPVSPWLYKHCAYGRGFVEREEAEGRAREPACLSRFALAHDLKPLYDTFKSNDTAAGAKGRGKKRPRDVSRDKKN